VSETPVIRIGTQGWSYPDWIGTFYPPGSKQEDYLPFYAEIFDTVELDTTFYHPPKPTIVRSWARHTPETFRFSAKVPQAITHTARLASMAEQMQQFAAALEPLGERLGPLLVQLPAEFERDAGNVGVLDRFLVAAPSAVRLAVEFRHASWHRPETYALLRSRSVALAWTDWRDLPRVSEVTADFLYLRWLGERRAIEHYDRVQVDRNEAFAAWEQDLRRALPQVREIYGYFNNHWAGHSPSSANEMKRRLGLAVVEWKDLWTQRELF
jgi:uncharacterized protein YecE (DUF72 family)